MAPTHRFAQVFGLVRIALRVLCGAVAAALVALVARPTHAQEAAAAAVSPPAAEPGPATPAATAAVALPPAPPPPAPWVYYPPPAPVDTRPFVPPSAAEIPPDDEGRYEPPSLRTARRLRTIGAVFMGFGLGSAVAGGAFLGIGASADPHTRDERETAELFTKAGVGNLVVGGVLALIGLPLYAVGTAKLP